MYEELSVMASPYFSVLLPTKNRSHLVALAVRSVLLQDFSDFELIICDNDDDPTATRTALQEYLHLPNIRYIRTGGLSMIENWNRALESSTGQFITVLEDKMIFYPDSFTKLLTKIDHSPSGVVVWGFDSIEDASTPATLNQVRVSEDALVQATDVLARVTKDIMGQWKILPRGLVTVIPRALVDRAKSVFGGDFYQPISPDFVSALKVLSLIDSYLITGDVYNLVTSNKVSNGKSMLLRREKDHSYMQGQSPLYFNLDLVPVKSRLIVANVLVMDYRSLAASHGGKLDYFPISHINYMHMMTAELIQTAVSARRVVWSYAEIRELIFSCNTPVANSLYVLLFSLRLIFSSLGRRLGVIRREISSITVALHQDPLLLVDQFLLGNKDIGDRRSFSST